MVATYSAHRVSIVGQVYDQQIVNVFNLAAVSDVGDSAQIVGDAFATAFKSRLCSQYEFVAAQAVDMNSTDGPTAQYSLATYESGTGGPMGEIGVSVIARWTDTVTGRAFRVGRSYLGPVASGDVDTGARTVLPTAKGQWQTALDAFLTTLSSSAGVLCIVHGLETPNQQVAPVVSGAIATNTAHLDSRRS
jgi:hypothetical protein